MAAPTIRIQGVEYPLPDDFTFGDLSLFKRMGVANVGAIRDEQELFSDPDAIRALLLIVKRRAGEQIDEAAIDEIKLSEITFVEGTDADPPTRPVAAKKRGG